MSYIVTIRRTADGKEVDYVDNLPWEESSEYMWNEGNYGCDCNRAIFFARAQGLTDPDRTCGHTAFEIVKIVDENGKLLWEGDSSSELGAAPT